MLALVTTPGGTAPVELRELPEPQSAPNEALVEVRAFSLNRGELRLFQIRPEGWRPGQDISGVVVASAADGSGPKAGARVVALTDNAGRAQRAAVPAHRMAVLPDNVRFEDAAALPVAGLTALRTLRHGAPLLGKRVLITGAAGGVGHLATQLAARSGARVTAVVGSPERGRHLRGADEIVDGIDKAQGRFALILESAGGPSLAAAIAHIEAKGTIVVFGNSSGEPTPISFPRLRRAPECAHAELLVFHIRSRGAFCAGPRITGIARRRRVIEAATRRAELARNRPDRPATAQPANPRQSRFSHRLNGGQPMTIKVGDKIPSVTLRYLSPEGVKAVGSDEFFAGKKVALFAVPAPIRGPARSAICRATSRNAAELKAKGVDTIACIAVNDPFVMGAWGKEHNCGDNIVMLGDGSGEFTRAVGLELDRRKEGMGMRSQRYSMLVDNGVVKALHVEEPGVFEVSSAEAMLKAL